MSTKAPERATRHAGELSPDPAMAQSSLSMHQLNQIEKTSKKQLDSISKLQSKLHRTQK